MQAPLLQPLAHVICDGA